MSEVITAPTVELSTEKQSIRCGHFTGMLGRFQLNAYNTLIACDVSHKVAHKISVDYGSDLGRLMASDADVASKVGKANDKGESRLSIKGSGKIATKYSMSIVRLAQQMHDLYKEGLLAERDLPLTGKNLQDYLAVCQAWADVQVWEEKKSK
jgi:hypothetical protein